MRYDDDNIWMPPPTPRRTYFDGLRMRPVPDEVIAEEEAKRKAGPPKHNSRGCRWCKGLNRISKKGQASKQMLRLCSYCPNRGCSQHVFTDGAGDIGKPACPECR